MSYTLLFLRDTEIIKLPINAIFHKFPTLKLDFFSYVFLCKDCRKARHKKQLSCLGQLSFW